MRWCSDIPSKNVGQEKKSSISEGVANVFDKNVEAVFVNHMISLVYGVYDIKFFLDTWIIGPKIGLVN